jgi:hypothetical protein
MRPYGRIVLMGVGDADAIGETVGWGTGCAPATNGVAAAMKPPARTIPMSHPFIKHSPSLM